MTEPENNYSIISILTRNRCGALSRVANAISSRGLQIHSLNTSSCKKETNLHQITIVAEKEKNKQREQQLLIQLNRIIHVIKVSLLDPKKSTEREIALIKIRAEEKGRAKALEISENYHAYPVDIHQSAVIFEVVGTIKKIDELIELLKPIGIVEYTRSGAVILRRGPQTILQDIQ